MYETALSYSILIFLCLAMHACNGRHLGIVDNTTKITSSSKVKMDYSDVKGTNSTRDVNILGSKDEDPAAATQELKERSKIIPSEEPKYVLDDKESSNSGLAHPVKAPVVNSFSWRVPQKSTSQGDQHPGFYSDYSQPRTRTPCHN